MVNANFLQLTREQLEARLLALHKSSLELVQITALDTLLQRIAALACEQAEARYAAVGVVGPGGDLEAFIPVGMSEEEVARMPAPPRGLGLLGVLMHSQESIRIAHISKDPRSVGFPKNHPSMESFLGVPIRHGGRHIGQIYLTDKIGAPEFTESDQLMIEMLAAYAAVAIINARIYRELVQRDRILTRRNENLALLNELSSTLATSTDIEQILDKALTQVLDYLQLEIGEVYLRPENSRQLKRVMHRGHIVNALWAKDKYNLGEGVIGKVAKTNQARLISMNNPDGSDLHPDVFNGEFHQVACLPITGRQGVVGVLCLASCHPRPLDELEMQFLATIGSWVGTAIESVRLNLQGRRLAVLEERERIGMDLHDGIIQSIYAVGLTLEHARLLVKSDTGGMVQRIEQAISDLNHTIRDIRTYILDLRPRQLYNESLMEGIRRLVQEFRANTLLSVNLQGSEEDMATIPDTQALALFHICQEALANIAKHARARTIAVTLWKATDRYLMEVADDGQGFDVEKMRLTIGHGLANMQTRARNVGGDVDFSSEPGAGTTILAWVPASDEN
ncbi:MAG: GAF domain-containing protein [Chloroflexi bacterium]|nr:MAG: GAF domain-containing protein [Chloroflexota bacterium]